MGNLRGGGELVWRQRDREGHLGHGEVLQGTTTKEKWI